MVVHFLCRGTDSENNTPRTILLYILLSLLPNIKLNFPFKQEWIFKTTNINPKNEIMTRKLQRNLRPFLAQL